MTTARSIESAKLANYAGRLPDGHLVKNMTNRIKTLRNQLGHQCRTIERWQRNAVSARNEHVESEARKRAEFASERRDEIIRSLERARGRRDVEAKRVIAVYQQRTAITHTAAVAAAAIDEADGSMEDTASDTATDSSESDIPTDSSESDSDYIGSDSDHTERATRSAQVRAQERAQERAAYNAAIEHDLASVIAAVQPETEAPEAGTAAAHAPAPAVAPALAVASAPVAVPAVLHATSVFELARVQMGEVRIALDPLLAIPEVARVRDVQVARLHAIGVRVEQEYGPVAPVPALKDLIANPVRRVDYPWPCPGVEQALALMTGPIALYIREWNAADIAAVLRARPVGSTVVLCFADNNPDTREIAAIVAERSLSVIVEADCVAAHNVWDLHIPLEGFAVMGVPVQVRLSMENKMLLQCAGMIELLSGGKCGVDFWHVILAQEPTDVERGVFQLLHTGLARSATQHFKNALRCSWVRPCKIVVRKAVC